MQAPASPWAYQRNGPLSPNYGSFGGGPVATAGRSALDPGRMVETIARRNRSDPRLQLAAADMLSAPEFQSGKNAQQPTQNGVTGLDWLKGGGASGLDYLYGGTNHAGGAVAGGSQPPVGGIQTPGLPGINGVQTPTTMGPLARQEEEKRKRAMQTTTSTFPDWFKPPFTR